MWSRRAALRLPVLTCVLASLALGLAACGGDDAPPAPTTPTVAPSADADTLFQQAIAAMSATTSLRFETTVYAGGDGSGDIIERRLDEQLAPDRVRRRRDIFLPKREQQDQILIGLRFTELQEDGTYAKIFDMGGGVPFSYPGEWQKTYGTATGYAVLREEALEGREATVLRKYGPDPEDTPEDDIVMFVEDLIWIEKSSGRILRWDVNKFTGKNAEDLKPSQHWESSLWQFNEELEIEFPPGTPS